MSRGARSVASPRVVNIADLRPLARKRLPRVVFDYIDGGAEGEVTLKENCGAFEELSFRPRQAVAVPQCDLRTNVLGLEIALPVLLAPVGYSRLMHPGGEVVAARAAGAAGTAYVLSTVSGHRMEDVKAASRGPVWYQLYLVGGRDAAEDGIRRARAAGFSALAVTIDTAVPGMRERDFRNGLKELLGASLLAKIPFLPQVLARPGWLTRFLRDGGLPELPNVVIPGKGPIPVIDVQSALARSVVTWEDLRWIRQAWAGPIVIKGVLTRDEARRAVDEGAAGVIVSNHGGRSTETLRATVEALPEVVAEVGSRMPVFIDGGFRRGTDVFKALALGAKAVGIGRPFLWGLGAFGQAGVDRVIEIMQGELKLVMGNCGTQTVADINRAYVATPDWKI